MEEAEALCDRLAILDHGKIVTIGSPQEIMTQAGAKNLEDAFIVLTGHKVEEEGGNFNELRRVRKTARRLQ
jgi:ABC-2 type transport system ATP-binding protein